MSAKTDAWKTVDCARGVVTPCLPIWIPRYAQSEDVFIWQKRPEEIEDKEEVGGGPGDEAVELWGAAAGFRREDGRVRCERRRRRSGLILGRRSSGLSTHGSSWSIAPTRARLLRVRGSHRYGCGHVLSSGQEIASGEASISHHQQEQQSARLREEAEEAERWETRSARPAEALSRRERQISPKEADTKAKLTGV